MFLFHQFLFTEVSSEATRWPVPGSVPGSVPGPVPGSVPGAAPAAISSRRVHAVPQSTFIFNKTSREVQKGGLYSDDRPMPGKRPIVKMILAFLFYMS